MEDVYPNSGKVALRKALPAKVLPEADKIGEIVADALRLREINRELDSVRDSAEAMLAASWRSGEPDVETLTDIRNWGAILNERLRHVTGGDDAWLATVQTMLADIDVGQ
jgi:hypothetical protein